MFEYLVTSLNLLWLVLLQSCIVLNFAAFSSPAISTADGRSDLQQFYVALWFMQCEMQLDNLLRMLSLVVVVDLAK